MSLGGSSGRGLGEDKRPNQGVWRTAMIDSSGGQIIMLYRDEVYWSIADKGVAELLIEKNPGPTVQACGVHRRTMTFADLAEGRGRRPHTPAATSRWSGGRLPRDAEKSGAAGVVPAVCRTKIAARLAAGLQCGPFAASLIRRRSNARGSDRKRVTPQEWATA